MLLGHSPNPISLQNAYCDNDNATAATTTSSTNNNHTYEKHIEPVIVVFLPFVELLPAMPTNCGLDFFRGNEHLFTLISDEQHRCPTIAFNVPVYFPSKKMSVLYATSWNPLKSNNGVNSNPY